MTCIRIIGLGLSCAAAGSLENTGNNKDADILGCTSDAAFGHIKVPTRHSTGEYLFLLFSGPINWKSAKQRTVTTSSTKAELLTLTDAIKEVHHWQRIPASISLCLDQDLSIGYDNTQTIRAVVNPPPQFSTKLRHIGIHHHRLRQEVQEDGIIIRYVRNGDIAVIGMIKILPGQEHKACVEQLKMIDITKTITSKTI